MRAIVCAPSGHLNIEERPAPVIPISSSLPYAEVRIKAFGVNRADLLQRAGHYPPPPHTPPDILGLEFAGEITRFSGDVEVSGAFQVGDRVMGICDGAAYAESIVVPRDQLLSIPEWMSFPQAAAIPEVHLTAFDALYHLAKVKRGERVLVHAIGSGVGVAAAHIAHFLGAEVIGTTRSAWKRDRALSELPVREVWLSEGGRFLPSKESESIDVILDFIGAAYLKENLRSLRTGGRIIAIGLLGGIKGEINLGTLLTKRATIKGTVLRSRSAQEKIKLTKNYAELVLPKLRPPPSPSVPLVLTEHPKDNVEVTPFYKVYNAQNMINAHQDLESGQIWSKVIGEW